MRTEPESPQFVSVAARPEVASSMQELHPQSVMGSDLAALRLRQQIGASSPHAFDAYSPSLNSGPLGHALFLKVPDVE